MKINCKSLFMSLIILITSIVSATITIDITDNQAASWTLEKDSEILLEDVYDQPFDYAYINSQLYMLISKGPMLVVYDLDGNLLAINEEKGEGPGELFSPVYIWDNPAEKGITIYDEGHFKYHFFDYDLNFQHSSDIENQTFINKIYHPGRGRYNLSSAIEFSDDQVNFLHSLTYQEEEKITEIHCVDCHMFLKGWYRYNQPVCRILQDNELVTAIQSRTEYKVMIINEGEVETTVTKAIKPFQFSKEEIKENRTFASEMEERFRNMYKTPEEILTNRMVISDLAVSGENIWILTRNDEGQYFDVLSSAGKLIAETKIGNNEIITRPYISGNYLYSIRSDDEDNYYLSKYRIKR